MPVGGGGGGGGGVDSRGRWTRAAAHCDAVVIISLLSETHPRHPYYAAYTLYNVLCTAVPLHRRRDVTHV